MANTPGTITTPLPHKSMPLISSRSNSCNCLSFRKGIISIRPRFGRSDKNLSWLRADWNAFGVEIDLHSTANFAFFFLQETSISASARQFSFVTGNKQIDRGGNKSSPLSICWMISFSIGIFLIPLIFLNKKINYFRKIGKAMLSNRHGKNRGQPLSIFDRWERKLCQHQRLHSKLC